MNNKKIKSCALIMTAVATMALGTIAIVSPAYGYTSYTKQDDLADGGKFHTDYNTFADAKKAANDLNLRLSEEGNTLLKNVDNALPIAAGSKLSVFGVKEDNVEGGGEDSVADSLRDAGFRVNPTLDDFYAGDSSAIGKERVDFTGAVLSSLSLYNDGAVFVISRTGGEGADLSVNTGEKVDTTKDKHAHLATDSTGTYKHYLMLTDSEQELLTMIEDRFDNVHIIINSSHTLEVGELKDDDKVKSILWVGRPGETGVGAIGEIYAGKVSPSGSLVDTWERDYTANPVWQNFGNNSQTGNSNLYNYADGTPAGSNSLPTTFPPMMPGFHGVDYEEGNYLGYRYYETKYYEMAGTAHTDAATANAWYKANVAYPFGYGQNYSTFSFNAGGLFTDKDCKSALGATVDAAKFASSVGSAAQIKTLYVPVTVANTGAVAGKKTVQVYVTAPYTNGGIEKSFVTLAGFAKTGIIQPGKSEQVVVAFNVQDFASYDFADKNSNGNKGYELDAGDYTVRVMDSAHFDLATDVTSVTDSYDEIKFNLSGIANLKLDDYSGNEVTNLFSEENGRFNGVRTGHNVKATANETTLSRADFTGTFPVAPTKDDLTFTDDFYAAIKKWECFDADDSTNYAAYDTAAMKADCPWVDDLSVLTSDWTQNADHGKYALTDISGVDPDSDVVLTAGAFKGKTGRQAWVTFVNSLTWDELKSLPQNGGWSTVGIDALGLKTSVDNDSPEDWHSTHLWCDSPTISATFNVDLANEEGIVVANLGMLDLGENLTGWYGPGMDTHRSHFSGRNNQYYSEDGLLAGYFAAAVVNGAESRGVLCYPKHFALNDQETSRDGELSFSWVNEQAMREIYLKPFQMAQQEGHASGMMTAFARVGWTPAADNYNLLTALSRKQWGFEGYFVTDGYDGDAKSSPLDLMMRAGNDLALGSDIDTASGHKTVDILDHYSTTEGGTTYIKDQDRALSGVWDATLRSGKGSVTVGTANTENDAQYLYVRECATRMLYNFANSLKTTNGIKLEQYKGKALADAAQGTALTGVSVAADASLTNGADMKYTLASGTLPAGVTLNTDGSISGTPTTAGNYSFTVKAIADNWQVGTADFTWTVGSAFTWDGSKADEAKVGTDFYGVIDSDSVSTKNYNSVAYSISAGALPAGLTLNEKGEISGKPTEAGTYTFTVDVTATKMVHLFATMYRPVASHFYYDMTIVVTADAAPVEDYSSEIAQLQSETSTAKTQTATAQSAAATAQSNAAAAQSNAAVAQSIADAATKAANDASAAAKAGKTVGVVGIVVGAIGLVAGAGAIVLSSLKKRHE